MILDHFVAFGIGVNSLPQCVGHVEGLVCNLHDTPGPVGEWVVFCMKIGASNMVG